MREGKDSRRGSIRHRFTLSAIDTGVKRYKGHIHKSQASINRHKQDDFRLQLVSVPSA